MKLFLADLAVTASLEISMIKIYEDRGKVTVMLASEIMCLTYIMC